MNHCALTVPSVPGSTFRSRRERRNQNVRPPTAASRDAHRKYDRISISKGAHTVASNFDAVDVAATCVRDPWP